ETYFAEPPHTRGGHLLEVLLDHTRLDDRRTGVNLDAARPQIGKRALRKNRHRLQADDVLRAAGHVDFTRGDHGGNAAMQKTVDPSDLVLARRPLAGDRMYVA